MKNRLSVILCIHDEGARIQATARSLACAFKRATGNSIDIELIVVLDAADDITNRYVDETLRSVFAKLRVTYMSVDFHSVGAARNAGIKVATGSVVAIVDSDDLFSENIFVAGYRAVMADGSKVYHPAYTVGFGGQNWIRKNVSSKGNRRVAPMLISDPIWPSMTFALKSLLCKVPYRDAPVGSGVGPEAWQWNVDTLDYGIQHAVIPRSAIYYRKKGSSSLFDQHINSGDLLAANKIFLSRHLANIASASAKDVVGPSAALNQNSKNGLGGVKKIFRKGLRYIGARLKKDRAIPKDSLKNNVPEWLREDQRTQYNFEHHIYPDSGPTAALEENLIKPTAFTYEYWNVINSIPNTPIEYLFIVPGITKGGAEQVLMNYLKLIYQKNSLSRVVLLATENREPTRLGELPKNVTFIQLGSNYRGLSYDDKIKLLSVLSCQISPRVLHVIVAEEGFGVIERYGKAISSKTKIYVSIFGPNRWSDNRRTHILLDNTKMAEYITRIFTDNNRTIDEFVLWTGLPRALFAAHYQPLMGPEGDTKEEDYTAALHPLKVLWAGRLDTEKRVDIYDRIAQEYRRFNPTAEFYVFGSAVDDPTKKYEILVKESSNVVYGGAFYGGVRAIQGRYDVFVLTSDFEGLPNALIEAASRGMVLVAPDVGGVSEVVTDQTGVLVSDNEDIDQYVNAIKSLSSDMGRFTRLAEGSKRLIKKRHSWNNFARQVEESDDRYLNETRGH